MSKNFLIKLLLLLSVILLIFFVLELPHGEKEGDYPELNKLSGNENFTVLKDYFVKLANEKGAPYAYEVLKLVKVRPGTDMHLMGHVVGEILYKQKGAAGIQYCTQDFRNACSHTIVVGLFSEKGVGALPEIIEACKKAPGGKGAYNMCFHGLGHGVLAFTGYDIPKTVDLCSQIKKNRNDGREFPECVGGAIMEIISGGDHDKELWRVQNEKYMSGEDPLYPCNNNIIPKEAKSQCYSYLTPHLFLFAGASLGNPGPKDFEKAFTYCGALKDQDPKNMIICYAGFGKEFVVLAKGRDIRKITEMSTDELSTVYKWCQLADRKDGKEACLGSALSSIYWGGENNRSTAISFCNIMPPEEQEVCFKDLIGTVKYYVSDKSYLRNFCSDIPKAFGQECAKTLL